MSGILSKNFHIQNEFEADFKAAGKNPPEIIFKTYPRFHKISLPKKFLELRHLKTALEKRHSTRTYDIDKSLSLEELSTILFYSAGINNRRALSRRFYPSGGACYPLEIYLGIFRVSGIKPSICHYNIKDHQLEVLTGDLDDLERIKQSLRAPWSREASISLFITSVWDRTFNRYGDRGYKIVLMEAGHLAQNIALTAAALDIGCINSLHFDRKIANKTLFLENKMEDTIYLAILGHEKYEKTDTESVL